MKEENRFTVKPGDYLVSYTCDLHSSSGSCIGSMKNTVFKDDSVTYTEFVEVIRDYIKEKNNLEEDVDNIVILSINRVAY